MRIRIKNFILFGLMFVLLVSVAYSAKIFGFDELRFDGALLINSTTLSIKTNDIVRMFVNSDGNVGIGTVSPSTKLDVNGTGPGNLFRVGNASNDFIVVNGTTGFVGIGITNPREALEVSGNIRPTTPLVSNLGTVLFDAIFDINLTNPEPSDGDNFGQSLSYAGDVNGDGYDDVIVGCKQCDGGGTDTGSAFIYFGNSSMDATFDVNLTNPEPNNGDEFGGYFLSSAGDVNGDGYDDVIVACQSCEGAGPAGSGAAFIYFGGSPMDGTFDVNLSNPEADASDLFAQSISSAGDVNGDGYQDVIVGCGSCDGGGTNTGSAFIYYGGSSMDSTADVTIHNPEPDSGDTFGSSVSSAGDVNGDGYDDVIIGCRTCDSGGTDSGSAYIYFGGPSMTNESLNVSINNPEPNSGDDFGIFTAPAGDVNGDGYDDVIVGCFSCDSGGTNTGSAFIYYGGSSMDATFDVNLTNPEPDSGDQYGRSVSSAGDINGDGYDDVIVGCTRCDGGTETSGAAFIYFGGSSMDATADVSLYSFEEDTGAGFGNIVSNAGDINGDGYSDVIVGCNQCDDVGRDAGSAYIYLGNGTRWQSVFAQNVNVNRGFQIGGLTLDRWALQTNTLFGISAPNWEIDSLGTASFQDLIVADNVGIGTTAPAEKLVVIGNVNISDSLNVTNTVQLTTLSFADGTTQTTAAVAATNDSLWNQSGNDIFQKDITGSVGIGTATPATTLDVQGKLNVTGNVSIAQDTLFVDNTSSRVGIGTSSPSFKLDVLGNIRTTKQVRAQEICDENGANCKDIRNTRWSRLAGDGTVSSSVKIASDTNGFPTLAVNDQFGSGVSPIGDLDGDGVEDIAVGAYLDDTGGTNRGIVYILFMNTDGTVSSIVNISSGVNGGPTLGNDDLFGYSVSGIGDLNGDGVEDIAVGAVNDDGGGSLRGAVHILFMNTDGTVSSSVRIADNTNGGPTLDNSDNFGSGVTSIGDLNGDGVEDIAVGANADDTGGGLNQGAVYILFMNTDGTVSSFVKTGANTTGGPTLEDSDRFGRSISSIGDLNGDGVEDIAVGAHADSIEGSLRGAVYILFLNTTGNVSSSVKIASDTNGGPTLANTDQFGTSVSSIGDLNGDGVEDIAVGAKGNAEAVYILFMNIDGTVSSSVKITNETNGGPTLDANDDFGFSVSGIGDLNGDGVEDLAVGTVLDDTGTTDTGAVHILFMAKTNIDFAGGKVGIGTDAPLNTLHVNGSGAQGGFRVTNESGTDVFFVNSTLGRVGIGITTPTTALDVSGTVTATAFSGDGSSLTGLPGTPPWNSSGTNVYLNDTTASVGIGTVNPTAKLDVNGTGPGNLFRVGNASNDFMVVNGTTGFVGIGVTNPKEALEVAGNIRPTTPLVSNLGTFLFDATEDITINNPEPDASDRFGISVSSAGDVNGDGYQDVIVGCQACDGGGGGSGSAFIYFGGPSMNGSANITINNPEPDASDLFGNFVSGAGDVNGDGYQDVIVGCEKCDSGGTDTGSAFIYYGGSSMDSTFDVNLTSPEAGANRFGVSVSSAGDVNGDGYSDVIVGCYNCDSGGTNTGSAYIYFGGSSMDTTFDVNLTNPEPDSDDKFGERVSSAGDVNGDGYSDVIVGCRICDGGGQGSAFIYFGGSSMDSTFDVNLTNPEAGSDQFGISVSSAGDVNGDGYDDVIVGCLNCDGGGTDTGSAFIYFGGSSMDATFDVNLTNPEPDNDDFGNYVSGTGDIDGDGYDDVIVGCPNCDGGGADSGSAFIYYGGSSMDSTEDVSIHNPEPDSGDNFGLPVSSAGDVNGDGIQDVIVGCNGCDGGGAGSGSAYIYLGNGTRWQSVFAQNVNVNRGFQIGGLTLDRWALQTNTLFGITAPNWEIDRQGTASFQDLIVADNVGIGTTNTTHELHVVGDANITNNLYLGQNLTDLAENIFSAEEVEAADVVVVADDMKVIKSYKAYDKKVVGVISTAPAATFGGNMGNVPLAISGRVPVKVTDENGPIEPGDLLTTSSMLGHAMKCNDYKKCFGNIIGKSLTRLEDNARKPTDNFENTRLTSSGSAVSGNNSVVKGIVTMMIRLN